MAHGSPDETRLSDDPTAAPRRAPSAMIWRVSGSLRALLACGIARYAEDGVLELVLEAPEAAEGGMVTISMPVPVRCDACAAPGAPCEHCDSTGAIDQLFSAWLAVRPGTADGTDLRPSVLLRGMLRPVSFRVRVAAAG